MVVVGSWAVVVRGRWGSWCGVVAQVAPVAEVVAQVARVAVVVAQVASVAVLGTVVGVGIVVVQARSCWCRRRGRSRRVHPGPGYGTAWSSTSCCCIVELRRIDILRGRTDTLGRGSWSSQGGPMRIVGWWLGRTC